MDSHFQHPRPSEVEIAPAVFRIQLTSDGAALLYADQKSRQGEAVPSCVLQDFEGLAKKTRLTSNTRDAGSRMAVTISRLSMHQPSTGVLSPTQLFIYVPTCRKYCLPSDQRLLLVWVLGRLPMLPFKQVRTRTVEVTLIKQLHAVVIIPLFEFRKPQRGILAGIPFTVTGWFVSAYNGCRR